MLGSHNTFTYKSAKWKIFNLFSNFWRCQDKIIDKQYNLEQAKIYWKAKDNNKETERSVDFSPIHILYTPNNIKGNINIPSNHIMLELCAKEYWLSA